MPTDNTKRLAKNTSALYFRMLLSMVVSLYTSRVVLNTLGVEDYGVYNVVGGVVAMLGFLNASMSSATARFLAFELGKGDATRLKKTFSTALLVHIGIALFIFVIAETIGLWSLNDKLVIPIHRMSAAHWVYQFSILSTLITITQAPYNASIIAHEKMDIYAYVEILNVILKLVIVYFLVIGNFDKLILYGLLVLIVSILIALIYRLYCIRYFEECHFHWIWDVSILKPMLTFSGWDLYGNMSVTLKQQGLNMLLNVFGGPILNSANGVASSVQGAILGFSTNILMAAKPQIIKRYAESDLARVRMLIYKLARYSCLLMVCISIPLIIEMEVILKLWLKIIPPYSIAFCRILLITNCLTTICLCLNIGIHATGNVKRLSIINGSLNFATLFITYLFFKMGFTPEWGYIISFIMSFITIFITHIILQIQIPGFSFAILIKQVLLPSIFTAVIAYIIALIHFYYVNHGVLRFFSVCLASTLTIILISLFTISTSDRVFLINIMKKYFCYIKR